MTATETQAPSVLFVCVHNAGRSQMAAAYLEELSNGRIEVRSAGSAPADQLNPMAVKAMSEEGIDLSEHRSRAAIPDEVARHDRVYCMTRSHREALLALLPPSKGGHVELLDPRGADVPDPYGAGRPEYRAAADRITAAIRARLDEWA